MVYDTVCRENDITALDTATNLTELGADSPAAVIVPDSSMITEVRIGVAGDFTADTLLGFSTGLHMWGSCGDQWLAGPVGNTCGAAGTSSGAVLASAVKILCAIPVKKGEQINLAGFMHGEDVGSIRMMVTLVFDGPVKGTAKRFDYREQDLAAANTPVTLNTRGGATEHDFKVSGGETIVEVHVGAGCKMVAGPLAATTHFKLSGNGLKVAGNYDFQGNSIHTQDDIAASGDTNVIPLEKYISRIETKSGQIRCQAQEVEDDVGTPYAVCMLGFA